MAQYSDSYANMLKNLYGIIKNGGEFEYSPNSDRAFRNFADEYNALGLIGAAANMAQAQSLTGGYGSSYAGDAAVQGYQRIRDSAENAKPLFYQQAQDSYIAKNDMYNAVLKSALEAGNDELNDYYQMSKLASQQDNNSQKNKLNDRAFNYNVKNDKRDFKAEKYQYELEAANKDKKLDLKSYDVYAKIAANKCADYQDKMDNKGMRNYLTNMVEQGKITGYMADNLYKQYKYVAPASRSGGSRSGSSRSGGSRSRSGGKSYSKSNTSSGKTGGYDFLESWSPNQRVIKFINLNNRAGDYSTALEWIDYLVKKGTIDKDQRLLYAYYYRDMLRK